MMKIKLQVSLALLAASLAALPATAAVLGESGSTTCAPGINRCFALTARSSSITTGDGNSLAAWGYGLEASGEMQYPGPTLLVNQGDVVQIRLTSELPVPVSIVLPGQAGVAAVGGTTGPLTQEIAAGGAVTYTFTASQPGTYLYHSGSRPELEVDMGLVGALVVRPTEYGATRQLAYNSTSGAVAGTDSTAFDREYLYLLSEMDRTIHEHVGQVEQVIKETAAAGGSISFDAAAAGMPALPGGEPWIDPAGRKATLWFMNGRNGPDTLLASQVQWLPNQPYNAVTRAHPGERVLLRIIGGGQDLHPFHHHGNNAWLIARDGRVLQSSPTRRAVYPDFNSANIPDLQSKNATLPDLAVSNFTIQITPGSTYDAIFTWTGLGLGWDAYGHTDCNVAPLPGEDITSHCRKFSGQTLPVNLPEEQSLAFGGYWSGSPYLGGGEALPPLQGGLNPSGGYTFMWHSHTERELTNDDIFPGGMMTMMIIEHPDVEIAD